ncbi:DENN domain-containing protein 2B-like [Lampetra planeri]
MEACDVLGHKPPWSGLKAAAALKASVGGRSCGARGGGGPCTAEPPRYVSSALQARPRGPAVLPPEQQRGAGAGGGGGAAGTPRGPVTPAAEVTGAGCPPKTAEGAVPNGVAVKNGATVPAGSATGEMARAPAGYRVSIISRFSVTGGGGGVARAVTAAPPLEGARGGAGGPPPGEGNAFPGGDGAGGRSDGDAGGCRGAENGGVPAPCPGAGASVRLRARDPDRACRHPSPSDAAAAASASADSKRRESVLQRVRTFEKAAKEGLAGSPGPPATSAASGAGGATGAATPLASLLQFPGNYYSPDAALVRRMESASLSLGTADGGRGRFAMGGSRRSGERCGGGDDDASPTETGWRRVSGESLLDDVEATLGASILDGASLRPTAAATVSSPATPPPPSPGSSSASPPNDFAASGARSAAASGGGPGGGGVMAAFTPISVNPVPKPRRTFEYHAERTTPAPGAVDGAGEEGDGGDGEESGSVGVGCRVGGERLLEETPVVSRKPRAARGKSRFGSGGSGGSKKSLEGSETPRDRGDGLPPIGRKNPERRSAHGRNGSEENVYEDIVADASRENPYEDVEPHCFFTGRKRAFSSRNGRRSSAQRPWGQLRKFSTPSPSHRRTQSLMGSCPHSASSTTAAAASPSSPSGAVGLNGGDSEGRRRLPLKKTLTEPAIATLVGPRRSLGGGGSPRGGATEDTASTASDVSFRQQHPRRVPKMVQKINEVFTAKRGKKRWRKTSPSNAETASLRGDNSESDSDSDDHSKEHAWRLVRMARLRARTRGHRTLERELLEWQERQLFECFLVVALRAKPTGRGYQPEVTYQFPKLERLTKEVRESEERIKAIPQFCFPDARDWAPITHYTSEMFSFVLTTSDGSRRFGYCRRLLPSGKGPRLPEVHCIVSRLGCFTLFSKILDEVERRRGLSAALVYPFMRALVEAPFPAPGRTVRVSLFLPGAGHETIELRRPSDSRLEHVDFSCLLSCLGPRQLLRVFSSLLMERRVIFTADKLSTLSKCGHAAAALLYPFAWQHTYVPVLPASMLDIACSPTPFLMGVLSSTLPKLQELPLEEVLVVDLCNNRFIRQLDDDDGVIPRKLHAALEQVLEQRKLIASSAVDSDDDDDADDGDAGEASAALNALVSEAFVRFFAETVGHFALHVRADEQGARRLHADAFRKAVASKSVRRFLEVFMQTQMFAGFVQDRELRRCHHARGLFELRASQFLDEVPNVEQSGVNRFLKELGSRMKFLSKKQ